MSDDKATLVEVAYDYLELDDSRIACKYNQQDVLAPMRYKFRGKRVDTGEWVYGFLVISRERPGRTAHFIIEDDGQCNEPHKWALVTPESIGQWSGLVDKAGTEIYEGDRMSYTGFDGKQHKGVVEYKQDSGCFILRHKLGYSTFSMNGGKNDLVTSNIHDTPELLSK